MNNKIKTLYTVSQVATGRTLGQYLATSKLSAIIQAMRAGHSTVRGLVATETTDSDMFGGF